MKKFKSLIVFVLFLVFTLPLTVLAAEEVTIEVATWADESLYAVIEAFNEVYPHIKVKPVVTAIQDHHNALLTRIAAGSDVPDVAFIEIPYIGQFSEQGGFEDLLAPPYNAGRYKDQIVSYAWYQATADNGKLVAMPTDIAPATLFVRIDRLNELGVKLEDIKTMEDWIEVGLKFTQDLDGDGKNDRWLVADAASIYNMIVQSGPEKFFDKDGNCIVDSPRFVRAFEMAKKIRDLGLDAQIGEWTNEWYATFKEGTTLITPSGAWLGGHIKEWIAPDTAGLWRAANLPDNMYASWGGSFAGIPEAAKHKEEAWKFIEFVATRPDIQLMSFRIAEMFPSLVSTYDDPMFDEGVEFYGGQKVRRIWAEAAQNIPDVITNRYDSMASDIVYSALSKVLEDGEDPEVALREAKQLIERRMRRR